MWPEVLEAVTGKRMTGTKTVLEGYTRRRVKGEHYPVVIRSLEDSVEGVLYEGLTEEAFRALDIFEGEAYERVAHAVNGTLAFVYVLSDDWKHIAEFRAWHPEDVQPEHLAAFCSEYKGWDDLRL